MIVAIVALCFSMTGTGIAASHYIISSTSQIKPSVRHALRGAAGSQGPIGIQGIQGPIGPAAPPNPQKIAYFEERILHLEQNQTKLCLYGIGQAVAETQDEKLLKVLRTIQTNCEWG